MTRTVPLKSGSWNSTLAVPSAPTLTMPENRATRRLDRRTALHRSHRPGAVAARAQLAALGAHAVDQAAVEVADLGAEQALGEEPVLRRGRLDSA